MKLTILHRHKYIVNDVSVVCLIPIFNEWSL